MSAYIDSAIRFLPIPSESFFLLGPRGTGKSTWIKQIFPDSVTLDLLRPDVERRFKGRPEELAELVRAQPSAQTFVIDEVQRAPELLSVVHALIEEKRGWRFALTGSSARKIKRSSVDLLGGRAVMRHMHPFMGSELGERFDLNRALTHGTLPLVWAAADPEDVLRAYVALYLREEVQMEGLVRNVGAFSRFLEAASFSHAAQLNMANVARESGVDHKSVTNYFDILEDLLLGFRMPVFEKHAKRKLSIHPKFYYFDPGVFRTLRPQGPLDTPHNMDDAALEGLVAEHLRSWRDYGHPTTQMYFWRTKHGLEVDFILYGKDVFYAIEVKNSARIRPEHLAGLRAFREDYPQCEAVLLYRGEERLEKDGIRCAPVDAFLRTLHPGRQLPLL